MDGPSRRDAGAMNADIVRYFALMLAKVAIEADDIDSDPETEARLADVILAAIRAWLDTGKERDH
jgi:hypothetical protein